MVITSNFVRALRLGAVAHWFVHGNSKRKCRAKKLFGPHTSTEILLAWS